MKTNYNMKKSTRNEVDLIGLSVLISMSFFNIFRLSGLENESTVIAILSSLVAGALSIILLKVFGYFHDLRLFPRKSDILIFISAMTLSGIFVQQFCLIFITADFAPLTRIMGLTPSFSILIFFVHYILSHFILKSRKKSKILLKLLREEIPNVQYELQALSLTEYFDVVSEKDLQAAQETEHEIEMIVISRGSVHRLNHDPILLDAHLKGIPIVDRRQMLTQLLGRVLQNDTDMWAYLMSAKRQTLLLRIFSALKTYFEPILAIVLFILLSPVLLVCALLIKATSKGPVFYRQVRTGYKGKDFMLIKFRSMRTDSEDLGHQWAAKNDNRITGIGKVMRKTRLDELPQLWNVILGEMSFIGPRPERPEFYKELSKEIPLFPLRTIVRPGITGWAQVCSGYAASVEESRLKLEYDLYYIQHMSPRIDFIVIVKTLRTVLFGSEYKNNHSALEKENAIREGRLEGLTRRAPGNIPASQWTIKKKAVSKRTLYARRKKSPNSEPPTKEQDIQAQP